LNSSNINGIKIALDVSFYYLERLIVYFFKFTFGARRYFFAEAL